MNDTNWPPTHKDDENIGKKFGKRTIIEFITHSEGGPIYLCECECGQKKEIRLYQLRYGRNTRCRQCAIRDSKIDRLNRKLFWMNEVDESDPKERNDVTRLLHEQRTKHHSR